MGRPERRQWFRLARQLGMSVVRAQREINSREFGEWMAYDEISPGDPERADLRAALISWTMATVMKAKKGKPLQIKNFLLKFNQPARRTIEEVRAKLFSWKAGMAGAVKKEKKK